MSQVESFSPVFGVRPRVLILGSMPGAESLRQTEYYAHPRNAFWWIMGELFGATPALPYTERLERLTDCRIALWDVLESCYRPGSLDSSIAVRSACPNKFDAFFSLHVTITHVFFNGRKAADMYRRKVEPELAPQYRTKSYRALPSTSPAHAALDRQGKLKAWTVVKEVL